ncbi:Sesquiterpene synthase 2 [Heracleum sosnowskyi]|uniref:Sesquiterpene synthase 2 n=1 Tax=Heracleum sosnowskyi TaxID=360622 RepID=A0AAD8MGI9_9APIA|nr:Sesquiterpene synthase 2 [Heracleum sosnowskyi]
MGLGNEFEEMIRNAYGNSNESGEHGVRKGLNDDARKFYRLVKEGGEALYPDCKKFTRLSFNGLISTNLVQFGGILANSILALSVSDDLYDAYGTMDELNTYTKAIERFDADCIKGLPGYSKICYNACVKFFREFGDEIVKQGSYYDFKTSVLAYHQEAVWRDKNYVPPLKEYLMNGSISSCACLLGLSSILGMGHADTIGACKWAPKEPKVVLAAEKMSRIINDIVGYEEEHSRPHVATSIECYMKEYGVSKEEAVVKLYEMIEDTWKDINKECLRHSVGMILIITSTADFNN